MKTTIVVLLILIVTLVNAVLQVDTNKRMIIDDYRRVRMFHGVNAVYKVAPYIPITDSFDPQLSLCDDDMKMLQSWGMNVVRLGVMWPGVMPTRDTFDEDYLAKMVALVNKLGSYGMYTIVDMHQDVYNRHFCGEGVPDWAVALPTNTKQFPLPKYKETMPLNSDGYPELESCLANTFSSYYWTDAVGKAFQSLYDNTNGIQDQLAKFWTKVASTFSGNPYVLAYELLNEPWAGDTNSDPLLLIPGVAGSQNLKPMYHKLNSAIRTVDNDHIIMAERTIANPLGATGLEVYGPGGSSYANRNVYSFHNYCGSVDGNGDPTSSFICEVEQFAQWVADMYDGQNLKIPSFLTEFGAVSGNSSKAIDTMNYLFSLADQDMQSWAYWQFKAFQDFTTTSNAAESVYYDNGDLQEMKADALKRVYPMATAGLPKSISYDPHKKFSYTYLMDTTISQPTDIFVPASAFPNGFKVSLSSSTTATWSYGDLSHYHVLILPTSSATNGNQLTVTIVSI